MYTVEKILDRRNGKNGNLFLLFR